MKYSCEITIQLSRERMLEILVKPENMKHWQKGLLRYEHISGQAGAEGSQMELEYQMGKRKITMVETIIKKDLPDEFHVTYDAKGVHNLQKNYFRELDKNSCKWVSETEFLFSGLTMKLMAFLMPAAFKKQSMAYLKDFKNFAESGQSVAGL